MSHYKFFILLTGSACQYLFAIAQPAMVKLHRTALPKQVKFIGHFIDAIEWTDSLGKNVVIRSQSGIYQSKTDVDSGTNSAALFAYRYLVKNDSAELGWKMTDFVKACELDITANFLDEALLVTDLDKDSIGEVWFIYQKACRGDVSPAEMKILMYEGKKKNVVRGVRQIRISEKEVIGGEYHFDNAFTKGPLVFRQYAKKLWKKFLMADLEVL